MDSAFTPLQRRTRRMYDASVKAMDMIDNFKVAYAKGKGTNLFIMEQSLRCAMEELENLFGVAKSEDK